MPRWIPVLTLLLAGCGLKRLLPEGPVWSEAERAARVPEPPSPSPAAYTGPAAAPFPLPPAIPWAIAYELDLVLVTDHPAWDMHELARIRTPEGPLWLAKDARAGTLEQTIVIDLPDPSAWLPEIPVRRTSGPVQVEDRSTADRLDLDVFYENIDGEPVAVSYQGPVPHTRLRRRNGSTMGHSRDSLLAVLDLPLRDAADAARVRIGGEPRRIRRILGLVPFRMALVQTQAGLAIGEATLRAEPPPFADAPVNALTWTWRRPEGDVAEAWQVAYTEAGAELVQRHPLRTVRHRFLGPADALGWAGATVTPWDREAPILAVSVHPALPDLRRPFEGVHTSAFAIDVGEGRSYAVGAVEAAWEGGGPVVRFLPTAPWWVADRPLEARLGPVDAPGDAPGGAPGGADDDGAPSGAVWLSVRRLPPAR